MKPFVIGVDGGGSKTDAVILSQEGELLGRGRGGPSNLHLVGAPATRAALWAAMKQAAQEAEVELSQAAAVVWALAGAGRRMEAELLRELQAELLPEARGRVVTDILAALVGGVGARYGVAVVAGTGAAVYGEDAAGQSARAGGWGHLVDRGSGHHIGLEALRAVARAADRAELPTLLTQRILATLNLTTESELIHWLYATERQVSDIAALAPLVIEVAQEGDLVATEIIARAADALAEDVDAVAKRLRFDEKKFPLVLTGGLLLGHPFFRSVVIQSIRTRAPAAQPRLPRFDAAIGAGLLAVELSGRALARPAEADAPIEEDVWASEQSNVLTRELDMRPTLEIVGLMHLEDGRAVASVRPNLPVIAAAIDAIAERMQKGGRLIYVGAGTSGRLGVLDASECPPTFNTDPGQVVGVIAGGERALTAAVEEAEDNHKNGAQAMIELDVGPNDSVVGIAASGRTPYVMGALAEARRRGALTAALICNLPAPLADMADYVLAPLVGPEVLAGSTRLKAGTTQKLVLNMLSTGVMVRLGKTYGNLMVDVRQHNVKLQERARRIVAQACHINHSEAEAALARCQGDVKAAIVSVLLGCTPEEARRRLARANGRVREAVKGASAA